MPADRSSLQDAVRDARRRTLELVADLGDDELRVPKLAIVNPLLWEIAHVAWFQEKWTLRREGRGSMRPEADAFYDSERVAHDDRWELPMPRRKDVLAYLDDVRDAALERLERTEPRDDDAYFHRLAIFHEDMHDEAFLMTRQSLAFASSILGEPGATHDAGPLSGDAEMPAVTLPLGSDPAEPFVFDNEKWSHPVTLAPFRIARAPVTQSEFAAFVEDGGYRRADLWSPQGLEWRQRVGAHQPRGWRREGGAWSRREFDRWHALEPHRPVVHVNLFEAEAFCRWANRRLPTEAEWEAAATWDPARGRKRAFPWGDEQPTPRRANLDARLGRCIDVAALPDGDSAIGCRQMLGNAWEWTASRFDPYPGFATDPYAGYSRPWFGTHAVLRGGSWATRARMIRPAYRNFYEPHRRDPFAGFRTCALA